MTENQSTEPLQQAAADAGQQTLEQAVAEMLAMQKRLLSEVSLLRTEVGLLREEANLRYADLRNRIELNNDKFDVVQRELRQLIKDTRSPLFTA